MYGGLCTRVLTFPSAAARSVEHFVQAEWPNEFLDTSHSFFRPISRLLAEAPSRRRSPTTRHTRVSSLTARDLSCVACFNTGDRGYIAISRKPMEGNLIRNEPPKRREEKEKKRGEGRRREGGKSYREDHGNSFLRTLDDPMESLRFRYDRPVTPVVIALVERDHRKCSFR